MKQKKKPEDVITQLDRRILEETNRLPYNKPSMPIPMPQRPNKIDSSMDS